MDKFLIKKRKVVEAFSSEAVDVEEIQRPQPPISKSTTLDKTDICHYVVNRVAKDEEKITVLKSIFNPTNEFNFPVKKFGKKNLKCQLKWFDRYKWLSYSKSQDGVYCKYCVIFSQKEGGRGNQKLGRLVTSEFSNWKDALEIFHIHNENNYHKNCVIDYQNLKKIVESNGSVVSVSSQLNSAKRSKVDENRKLILPVIKCIILCGRQGISLRGHRESYSDFSQNEGTDGNFLAILRFGLNLSDDEELRKIRAKCPKNASYTSPDIQNEIIEICGSIIQNKIIADVKKSKYFAILADETSDVSNIEQFSLCVRYVDESKFQIVEKFLEFVPLKSATGNSMANVIKEKLDELSLDINNLRGQGYDGAAAMSGEFNGVQAIIKSVSNSALYVHCANHCLNLTLSSSSDVSLIRNVGGIVESIYNFFNTPKKQNCLNLYLDDTTKHKKIQRLNPTRWVERHTSISTFLNMQKHIISALEDISEWTDNSASSMAVQLLSSIRSSDFNVALRILNQILAYTLPLSRFLQKEGNDLAAALRMTENIQSELQSMRSDSESTFSTLFSEIIKDSNEIEFEVKLPRICKRQTKRSNIVIPNQTPESYYRINLYNPFLDTVIQSLNEKFTKHKDILKGFQLILNNNEINETDFENSLKEINNVYKEDLIGNLQEIKAEIKLWRRELTRNPEHAINLLQKCNKEFYPNVYNLLKIFCCIPVSNATTERSFSSLKLLKTYLRNTTAEGRLNGLTHLFIHKDIEINPEEVLNEFCRKTRRINFSY